MKKSIFLVFIFGLFSSCELLNSNPEIEVTSSSTTFEYKQNWENRGGDIFAIRKAMIEGREYKNIIKDAYFLNLNLKIQNNTEEKIEEAKIQTIITLKFPSKSIKLNLKERNLYDEIPNYWSPGITINYEDLHFLNIVTNFNPELFEHNPEIVNMEVFITVKNSVGLYLEKQIISNQDITTSWNSINN